MTEPVSKTALPTAYLRVLIQPINPPKPVGINVVVGFDTVAVLDIEHVRRVLQSVELMDEARATPKFSAPVGDVTKTLAG